MIGICGPDFSITREPGLMALRYITNIKGRAIHSLLDCALCSQL